ncbi:hypothetical protein BKH46_09345 [Helicobacter sp. 12S02634-8]|uniref:hypothetical protein n=1 Tax=Helicobacter sp. 12S02634-8 TaxID=1476199 RepID=UPI000BA52D1F|nr:hypothetical protein [Helicobacter sp. 12S02634-8]PAF44997.1 hypothetical protein BKH46_09345 [Helicobacter sp. 12S02634-8]
MRTKAINSNYRPNKNKIILDYGNEAQMCESRGIKYTSYRNVVYCSKKNRIFKNIELLNLIRELIKDGYVEYVGEAKNQGVCDEV